AARRQAAGTPAGGTRADRAPGPERDRRAVRACDGARRAHGHRVARAPPAGGMMALDALCFGAHPDDVELTSGGLAARLARHGHPVGIVDLTRGEAGSRGTPEARAREAVQAAKALGVAERHTRGLPDLGLDRHDPRRA